MNECGCVVSGNKVHKYNGQHPLRSHLFTVEKVPAPSIHLVVHYSERIIFHYCAFPGQESDGEGAWWVVGRFVDDGGMTGNSIITGRGKPQESSNKIFMAPILKWPSSPFVLWQKARNDGQVAHSLAQLTTI